MSGIRTAIPATAIITLTIATTVAGCGGEPAGIAQSPPAGSATVGSAGATPSASESVPPPRTMRFSAKTYACTPKADPQLRGAWITDAPRYRVKPGQSVALGLRDRHKGPTGHVIASVYTRHGGHAYARTMLRQDKWAVVHFPRDFINARTHKHIHGYPKGVYTVVWDE